MTRPPAARPVLVDRTVLVDHLRNEGAATLLLRHAFSTARRVLGSVLTKGEVLADAHGPRLEPTLDLLALVEWLPVTGATAEDAAALMREHGPQHPRLTLTDCVIAATAQAGDLELWTREPERFPLFPDLRSPY